jgi:hypothetical protein
MLVTSDLAGSITGMTMSLSLLVGKTKKPSYISAQALLSDKDVD